MSNLFGFQSLSEGNFLKKINIPQLFYQVTFLFFSSFFLVDESKAQNIKWDFDGGAGTDKPVQTVPNVSVSALSVVNNNGTTTTLITSSSSSFGYIEASGNYNAGAAAVPDGFNPSTSTYFEFTVTVDQGYSINVNGMSFGARSTGTGPQSYSIRSSVDSYNSDIATNSLPPDSKWYLYQNSVSLSSTSSITFRIYGFNGINASKNTTVWRIDDLIIDATVSAVQTYYRSRQNGNWATPATWEYSTDNVNWNVSSILPTKDVESILIQPGHTINVASSVSLDQTTIAGILELKTGGVLNINDGTGDDISILSNGVLKVLSTADYSTSVQQAATANINIASGGKIIIGDGSSSTGNGYEAFATSNVNLWNDASVFEWNNTGVFQIAGLTYFPNASATIIPVFNVRKVNGTMAAGTGKDFYMNGLFQFSTDVSFSGAGKKYFRNGIKGSATITQLNAGKFYLNNTKAVLDGTALNFVLAQPIDLGSKVIIPSGAVVTVSGSNLSNSSGNLTVNGTLDMTTSTITNSSGLIIINGTYRTANSAGFSGNGSSIPSTTGTISLTTGSTIELYASGNQSLNARTDFSNLIFSGSGIKTPLGSFSPAGTVTIKDAAIFDCSGRNIGDETSFGPTATNLTMSGNSRLIIDTYGPNPKMGGTYNLTGGVIEFKGSNGTPETIRSKNYQNIEVTGNNVSMSEGNITLNNNGTFTVKNGGIFSMNDNTINGTTGGVQTVTVKSGGYFKCGTNMGFNGATITSIPIKSSAINADIENIILETNSTVDYSRTGDQPITNAGGLVYQNMVISGSGNKTAPSNDLNIQGNLSKTTNATFIHNSGTVILNGSNSQTYSCNSPQIVFNNLTNGNTVGLNINDSLSVYNQLSLKDNSVINLNADISLLSSKDNTASIGQLSTNAHITYSNGRFIVERYINTSTISGHQKSWQLLSTPAFGETVFNTWQEKGSATISGYGTWITGVSGTSNGFDASSPAPSMKNYDAASNNWIGIAGTDILLQNEKGYMIFIRGDRLANNVNSPATPTVLRTRGKLYSAQFPPPICVVPAGKFQCVGNPYASAIDFEKINSSNIGSNYIAWDATLGGIYGYGGYQTISAATNYAAVPGGTSNYTSMGNYQYIQSGQAFFVSNYKNADGFVSFSEDCKTSGKYHMVNRESEHDKGILFANLVSKAGVVVDGNAVSFSSQFSNKIDGDDAIKFGATAENFAVKRMGNLFTVEAREEINITDTIFYSLRNLTKQDYTIILYTKNLRSPLDAYLIDSYLKTEKQINFSDSSVINFSVTDDKASSNSGRFYVVFRAAEGPLAISVVSMNAHVKDENVLIEWKVENEIEVKNYEVENSADGIHFTQIGVVSASDGLNKNYNFTHFQPTSGKAFYRIKINKINGESEYQKVLKVLIPSSISAIHIYPNPVQGKVINLKFVKQPLGKYRFTLNNSLGQKVLSKEIIYKGEASLSLNSIQILSTGVYQLQIIKPNGERELLKVKSE